MNVQAKVDLGAFTQVAAVVRNVEVGGSISLTSTPESGKPAGQTLFSARPLPAADP
jgi:hypothetical protein